MLTVESVLKGGWVFWGQHAIESVYVLSRTQEVREIRGYLHIIGSILDHTACMCRDIL
jgi:hypothetical protein